MVLKPLAALRRSRAWVVVFLTFLIAAISYLDRNNLSIAASFVQHDFELTNLELGYLFSAFLAGYAIAQPVAGWFADRTGPYRAIAIGLVWWSVCTLSTAYVPQGLAISFTLLVTTRLLLGLGEAIIFPAANRLVANWIPSAERGLATGIIFASVGVGGGIAPPLITYILLHGTWADAFVVSGVIGLAASLIWILVVRDEPAGQSNRPLEKRSDFQVAWRDILLNRQVQLLTTSYFCLGYVAYIFFTWFFKYLSETRGLDLKSSAVYAALPFVAMAIASPVGGLISDAVTRRWGRRIGRCGLGGVGLGIAAVFVWLATFASDARIAAIILTGGAASLYLTPCAYWALSADLCAKNTGRISSMINMGGQIGGIATASLTAAIADLFGWSVSFSCAAIICLFGAALWIFVDPDAPLRPSFRSDVE